MPLTYPRHLPFAPYLSVLISRSASSDTSPSSLFFGSSAADLSLIVLLFVAGVGFGPLFGDFQHHLTYPQDGSYAPLTAILRDAIPLPPFYSIVALNLLVCVLIPWACLRYRFGRNTGLLYLYGSMIPVLSMSIWFIPQMMLTCFMLLPLVHPAFALLWVLAPITHSMWLPAFVLWGFGMMVLAHQKVL